RGRLRGAGRPGRGGAAADGRDPVHPAGLGGGLPAQGGGLPLRALCQDAVPGLPGGQVPGRQGRLTGTDGDGEAAVFVPGAFLPVVHDPWKDPQWRWLRAGYLLAHCRQPLRRDDEATRAAWLFRRELSRCQAEADGGRLARLFPAVAEAHSLYSAADSLNRWEVEARLLA